MVVPTLDEAARLPHLLSRLRTLSVHEVLVVDGGSRDGTPALARHGGATVIEGVQGGRGPQLAAGARAATGDVLWFLHADADPPDEGPTLIGRALARPEVVGGAFRLHTIDDGGPWHLGPLLRLADLRSRTTRLPYGDQGLFARRAALEAIGGVPELPIFEDLELARRLWTQGRLVTLPAEVRVSGRRFTHRPVYHLAVMNLLPVLYRLGVPAERLARAYPRQA